MRLLASASLAALLAEFAAAHYTFPALIVGGVATPQWQYVRMTDNHYSNGPVTDVKSASMKCYEAGTAASTSTATVVAGSTVGFTVGSSISHPGYLSVYVSRANPANAESAGSGATWAKIYEMKPTFNRASGFTWPSQGLSTITFTIPKALPSGEYLVRIEHIALHSASSYGGAQLYISCGQINVTGGGSGTPGPLVAFPGAYTGYEPGIMLNIYPNYPADYTGYTAPGPPVWTGN